MLRNVIADDQTQQQLQALRQANRVRLARAELKRKVATGELSVAEIVTDSPWEASGMEIGDLLRSQRRWGAARCRRVLVSVGLAENKQVGTLTDRQRRQPRPRPGHGDHHEGPRRHPGAGREQRRVRAVAREVLARGELEAGERAERESRQQHDLTLLAPHDQPRDPEDQGEQHYELGEGEAPPRRPGPLASPSPAAAARGLRAGGGRLGAPAAALRVALGT
jgi:hypothetical protein